MPNAKDDARARAQALLDAARRAGDADVAELLPRIAADLRDDDARMRHAALDALGRIAVERELAIEPPLFARVVRLAKDDEPLVRAEAAVALAIIARVDQRDEVRPILHELLEDESPFVRREAAAAIGDVEDHAAADRLARHLTDEDREVRFEAAFALATFQDPRALPELVAALDEARLRLDACEALRRSKAREAIAPVRRLAEKLFLAWPERLTAWATVYELGEKSPSAERILDRTRARNREERSYALSLIGSHRIEEGGAVLAGVVRSKADPLRDTAIRALGELGDPAYESEIARVASDPDATEEEKSDAAAALEKLRKG